MAYAIMTEIKRSGKSGATYIKATAPVNNPYNDKPYLRRVPYDYGMNEPRNHEHAAHCLAVFMGLTVDQFVVANVDPVGTKYCFIPYHGEVIELGKGSAGR